MKPFVRVSFTYDHGITVATDYEFNHVSEARSRYEQVRRLSLFQGIRKRGFNFLMGSIEGNASMEKELEIKENEIKRLRHTIEKQSLELTELRKTFVSPFYNTPLYGRNPVDKAKTECEIHLGRRCYVTFSDGQFSYSESKQDAINKAEQNEGLVYKLIGYVASKPKFIAVTLGE